MMDHERRKRLRVFLRVGFFAIATALSAIALIRILAVSRQIQLIQQQLDSALSVGEDLKQKNEQLQELNSSRDQHRAAAIRNDAYIGRYYQLCREPYDLPQLKTDFIVRDYKSYEPSPIEFAFSVPEGRHSLSVGTSLRVGTSIRMMSKMDGSTTNLTFPLLPSSGYFIRLQIDAEPKSETGQLLLELTSNNAEFKPIRQPLPHTIKPSDPSIGPYQVDDPNSSMEWRMRIRQMSKSLGNYESISYPNSVINLNQTLTARESGEELATAFVGQSFTLRFSVISDSRECISAAAARDLGIRGALQPYTGNGRFYIYPNN